MALPLMRSLRARNQPSVDGIAHGGVGGSSAFRPHVALGGETGHQVGLCRQRRQDGALRHRLFHRLQVFRSGVQEQVNMCINQPWHQRHVTHIDDLRPGWTADFRPSVDYPLALHEHFARTDDLSAFDVEQSRRVKHDDLRWCLCVDQDGQDEGAE